MTGATCQDFVRNWTRGTEDKTFTKAAVSFKNQLIIKNRFGSNRRLGDMGYKVSQKARKPEGKWAQETVSVFFRVSKITLQFAKSFDQLNSNSKKYSVSREQSKLEQSDYNSRIVANNRNFK